jgi:hypothetical protein
MTIVSSGNPLSFSQIRIELEQGGTGELQTTLADAFNGAYGTLGPVQRCQTPYPTTYAVSAWYGYDHTIRATARTGSPFAFVPTDTSCDTACDVGFSLTFNTSSYQFSGGTIWYLDNGCNNFLPAGKYMETGRAFCHTIAGDGTRSELYGCTTTTTTTTSTTTAAPVCRCNRGICTVECGSNEGISCTNDIDCFV